MGHRIKVLPPVWLLKECFEEIPAKQGILVWRARPLDHFVTHLGGLRTNGSRAGKRAGNINKHGYLVVGIGGLDYSLHRVVWKMVHGREPPELIDHIDGDRSNNHPSNLRGVTVGANGRNINRKSNNSSGYNGVVWHKVACKWMAQLGYNSTSHYVGCFNTAENACMGRWLYEQIHKFDFTERHGQ